MNRIERVSVLASRSIKLFFVLMLAIGKSVAVAQSYDTIYNFTGQTDGSYPIGNLISDDAGNFYGVTYHGGDMSCPSGVGCGTVYEMSPNNSGGWNETVLYAFTGGADGSIPIGGLALDASGNLYGTTFQGGTNGTYCGPGGVRSSVQTYPKRPRLDRDRIVGIHQRKGRLRPNGSFDSGRGRKYLW